MSKKPIRKVLPPFVAVLVEAEGKPTMWVGADGKPVKDVNAAQKFTLHRSITLAERAQADMLIHEIAGGLDAWLDMSRGLDGLRLRMRHMVEAVVWKDGRPDPKTPEEAKQQEVAFASAWAANDSKDRRMFQEMQAMCDRIDFMARWQVSATREMPEDWRRLSERELDPEIFNAIWNAHEIASKGVAEGK